MKLEFSKLGLSIISFIFINCSSNAMIKKTDGLSIEGKIISGDQESVYLQNMVGETAIKKSEIREIDHPGNGLAVIGGALTAYGILNIIIGASNCGDQENPVAYCTGVFLPAAVGVPLLVHGVMIWKKSTGNLNKSNSVSLHNIDLYPLYSYDSGKNKFGIILTKGF